MDAGIFPLPSGKDMLMLEYFKEDLPVYTIGIVTAAAAYLAGCIADSLGRTPAVIAATLSDPQTQAAAEAFCLGAVPEFPDSVDIIEMSADYSGFYMADSLYRMCPELTSKYDFFFPYAGGTALGMYRYMRDNAGEWQVFDQETDISYPELTGNKAILIGASTAWNDYRHQADVMDMYRMLLERGYSDDDIVLILENNLAYNPSNTVPGVVRTSSDGPNLYSDDMEVDYRLSDLTAEELFSVLTGQPGFGSGDNVLFYWCGHGIPDALVFGDISLTSSWVRRVLETMHENGKYRKLFCLIETCFAGSVAEECSGIPGVLLYTATNPNETSKAENFDPELNVYLSDRFSAAFRAAVAEREDWTMADLYYELYNHTPGSHVTVFNSDYYGNLYSSGISEYLDL